MVKKTTKIERPESLEDVLGGDLPTEDQEVDLGDSVVEPAEGEFNIPETTAVGNDSVRDTGTKELTELEKEIEAGVAKAESDIRARAAARPTTIPEAIDLVPELKPLADDKRLYYLHKEIKAYDVPYSTTGSVEVLAVELSKLREATDGEEKS